MAREYFRIFNDMDSTRRATVSFPMTKEGNDAQWELAAGRRWPHGPIQLEVGDAGALLEWNIAAGAAVPVVSARAAQCLCEICGGGIERVRATVSTRPGDWEILVVPVIDCAAGDRRDLMAAISPTIVADRAGRGELFRLPNLVTLVCTGRIRDAFLRNKICGADFKAAAVQ